MGVLQRVRGIPAAAAHAWRMRIGAKAAVLDVRLWCALGVPLPQRAPGAAPRQPTARGLGSGVAKQAGRARGPQPAGDPLPWPWPGPGRRQLESRGGLEAGSFGGCVNGLRHGSGIMRISSGMQAAVACITYTNYKVQAV